MGIIRNIRKIIISRNPENGAVDNLGGTGEVHQLSDQDGSLESLYYEEKLNQHCGCFAPPGGRCQECGVISCVRCHQHCGGTDSPNSLGCGKPLCREHCFYITFSYGTVLPFCKRCQGKVIRKSYLQKAGRLLLRSLIEVDRKGRR